MIVIGGGDTGADCVASAHREGAASVTQIELLGEPPATRPDDLTPWPLWPLKLRTSYALKEGGERQFAISTTGLSGEGRVERIHWVAEQRHAAVRAGRRHGALAARRLVLLAMGFVGPEPALLESFGVDRDARGNIETSNYATSAPGVFAAGDAAAASRSSSGRSRKAAAARPPSTSGSRPETAPSTWRAPSRTRDPLVRFPRLGPGTGRGFSGQKPCT